MRLRMNRELHWMLKLRTVYPFGLNDRMGDEFKIERNQKLIACQFPKLDRQFVRGTKGSGKGHRLNAGTMNHLLHNRVQESMHFI